MKKKRVCHSKKTLSQVHNHGVRHIRQPQKAHPRRALPLIFPPFSAIFRRLRAISMLMPAGKAMMANGKSNRAP